MKTTITTLVTLLLCTVSAIAGEREMTLTTPTGEIYGTLTTPDSAKAEVVALIIAGSGPTDRNCNNPQMKNNAYKFLAEDLAQAGIATLRYDKRGIAQSTKAGGREEDLRFQHYIDDATAWVELLSADFAKVVVIGHSEGALIGAMASQNNPKVAGFVSIAGTGDTMGNTIKRQIAESAPIMSESVNKYVDELVAGRTISDIPQELYAMFRPSVQPYLISCLAINPAEEIAKVGCPVMIIQGRTDIQVRIEDAMVLYMSRPTSKLVVLDDINHVLKESESTDTMQQMQTYISDTQRISPLIAQNITEFIGTLK